MANQPWTIGVNLSSAEYTFSSFPTDSDLNYLQSEGVTLVRLPIAWELMQHTLYGALDPTYLAGLKSFLDDAAAHGIQAIVDLHNYGGYSTNINDAGSGNGQKIGTAAVPISAFTDLWTKLATTLNGHVGLAGYDLMNEPNGMPSPTTWPQAAQAAVNAIRTVDMNTSIYVEGDHFANARNWLNPDPAYSNANLIMKDPANKIIYEAHVYFDDGSSNYALSYDQQGVTQNSGVADVAPFLQWLQQNNLQGFVGEFGVPNNDPRWTVVLNNFMNALQAAGVSGTEWYYASHKSSDPSWWPLTSGSASELNLAPMANGQMSPDMALIFDHTAPIIISYSLGSGLVGNGVGSSNVLTLTGTAAANSTVAVFDGTKQLGTATASANGAWSFVTPQLSGGVHNFTAKDSDSAGNTSLASAALNVTVDTLAPSVPVITSFSPDNGTVGDHITNDNTLTLTGTAVANSTVAVFDGTKQLGTATANGSGAWTYTTAALSNGAHSLTATPTDAAGNIGAASSALSVTIDTTAPVAPAIASFSTDSGTVGDDITNATVLTLTGTAEANSTVAVFDGTKQLGTATANGSGAWSYTTGTLAANSSHSFTAKATDAAGNASAASAALNVTVDAVAPSAPAINSVSPDSGKVGDGITNVTVLTLTGTAEANSTVTVFDGTKQLGTATANASGAWSLTTGTLASVDHSFTAKATDAAGNTSTASAALNVTVDAVAPSAPVIASDTTVNTDEVLLTGSAEANSLVTLFDGTTQLGSVTANGSGGWSYTTGHLLNGAHAFTATAMDAAGNTSLASPAIDPTIGAAAPAVPHITSFSPDSAKVGDGITNASVLTLTGNADAGSTVKIFDGTIMLGIAAVNASGVWNFATTKMADGSHSFTVTDTNAAGNTSAASTALNVTVDTHAPTPAFTNLVHNSNGTVTLSGTSDANSVLSIYDGTNTSPLGTATANSNGTWSFTTGQLSNTVHSFTLKTVDVAGNVGTDSGAAVYGSTYNDTLKVGPGNDLVMGHGGNDTFVFGTSFGKDVITDFQASNRNHDTLQFSHNTFSSFAAVLAHAAQVGSDVVITADAFDTITLKNVQISSLQKHDIHIV